MAPLADKSRIVVSTIAGAIVVMARSENVVLLGEHPSH